MDVAIYFTISIFLKCASHSLSHNHNLYTNRRIFIVVVYYGRVSCIHTNWRFGQL